MLGVVGDLVQDIVVWQLEPIREATDTKSEVYMLRGGSAANVAAFAGSRYPTRFIGCVGDDLGGFVLRKELQDHGVDAQLQTRDKTGMIVVLIDEEVGERHMFPSRGASARLETIDPAWLDDLEVLHVTGYSFESGSTPQAVADAVKEHRRRGGRVSLDVSSVGMIEHYGVDGFLELMTRLDPDFISANRDESLLLGLADGDTPGPNLRRFPRGTLLARAGKEATHIFTSGHLLAEVPVTPVEDVRDLTGAGDAFNAGFLTAHLNNGGDLVASCEAAHALSARVLRSAGATEPDAPTAEDPAS